MDKEVAEHKPDISDCIWRVGERSQRRSQRDSDNSKQVLSGAAQERGRVSCCVGGEAASRPHGGKGDKTQVNQSVKLNRK